MLNDCIDIARCSVCPQVNTGDLIFLILTTVLCHLFLFSEKKKEGKGNLHFENVQVLLSPLVTYVSIKSVAHVRLLNNSHNIHTVKVFTTVRRIFTTYFPIIISIFRFASIGSIFLRHPMYISHEIRRCGELFCLCFKTSVPCSRIDLSCCFSFFYKIISRSGDFFGESETKLFALCHNNAGH